MFIYFTVYKLVVTVFGCTVLILLEGFCNTRLYIIIIINKFNELMVVRYGPMKSIKPWTEN